MNAMTTRGGGEEVDAGVKRQHALPHHLEDQRRDAGGREDGEQYEPPRTARGAHGGEHKDQL